MSMINCPEMTGQRDYFLLVIWALKSQHKMSMSQDLRALVFTWPEVSKQLGLIFLTPSLYSRVHCYPLVAALVCLTSLKAHRSSCQLARPAFTASYPGGARRSLQAKGCDWA